MDWGVGLPGSYKIDGELRILRLLWLHVDSGCREEDCTAVCHVGLHLSCIATVCEMFFVLTTTFTPPSPTSGLNLPKPLNTKPYTLLPYQTPEP